MKRKGNVVIHPKIGTLRQSDVLTFGASSIVSARHTITHIITRLLHHFFFFFYILIVVVSSDFVFVIIIVPISTRERAREV